ncbi:type VI secretion system ATPase TssH [Lonepinella sp. MS14437]|uniref:type VI secretion system ATPase TssH n=1 Tax=unclassified Lonepinella TaxID=2642006 RepID=UPI0036DBE57B
MKVELSSLINKLSPIAKTNLESSASECMSMGNNEILVSHFLLQCLETPLCDIRKILIYFQIDHIQLKDSIINVHPTQPILEQGRFPSFSPLLIDLLQDAWLLATTELNQTNLRTGTILLALLAAPQRYLLPITSNLLVNINRDLLKQQFETITSDSTENENAVNSKETQLSHSTENLSKYAQNLTELARNNKIDPVLCRDQEINLMIDILSRRRKNNPIIIGEAGVGKSALIEGLALRIISGNVPSSLANTEIMSLDLGAMQAGASVKGEFEKRFKAIMNEVSHSATPIILFIDEAHTLIGAGNQQGGLDVSNLLKPALARGELKTIAATTWSEYKKYIEKDAALSRRFQLVKVNEPNVEQAITILRGLQSIYENNHNVLIEEEALITSSKLSDRYLTGRQLPDKAIDVLDTACARVAINFTSPPKQLATFTNDKHQKEMEKKLLEREMSIGLSQDNERLRQLDADLAKLDKDISNLTKQWEKQKTLVGQIIELRQALLVSESADSKQLKKLQSLDAKLKKLQNDNLLVSAQVTKKEIEAVIAEWTGVPLDKLSQNDLYTINHLPEILNQDIKGQELAIKHLHKHLLTAKADLRRLGRPLGSFLLVGPSGVGKTETVVQIADLLFGGKQYLTTINMSEFQEKHTVSRLIGSPPGYIGYGEGGVLTEAIRRKPYSVVLLDEVEKAHPDVLNLFYQAFDKGELADGEGRLIDCKNIVFFLTSNLGYQAIIDNQCNPEKMYEVLYPILAEFFKPALLARMEVVPYLPLNQETLLNIVNGKLNKLTQLLETRFETQVNIDEQVKTEILARATRAENGARILESIIDGELLPPVSLLLLQSIANKQKIEEIKFTVKENKFVAQVGNEECELS